MNNEEKILQMLTNLGERLERVENRTEILTELSERLERVENRAAESVDMLTEMNGRLERVENRAAESADMLKAVLHNQEVARAEISGLKVTTVSADGLRRVDAKLNALNERLFAQETNWQELKLVK